MLGWGLGLKSPDFPALAEEDFQISRFPDLTHSNVEVEVVNLEPIFLQNKLVFPWPYEFELFSTSTLATSKAEIAIFLIRLGYL